MHLPQWLNKNIFAMGLASLFSDFAHEMATAVLPAFLISMGGSPALLGLIEGLADASISIARLSAGWLSDFLNTRKPFILIGYIFTGLGIGSLFLATRWYHILFGRIIAWGGKGFKKPARDALLVESSSPGYYGKIFGFHRGMDTVGAVLGPTIALGLLYVIDIRTIFLVTLIPSIISVLVVVFAIKDVKDGPYKGLNFWKSIQAFPLNFRLFLVAVAIFGCGNFAVTLLIMRVIELLKSGYSITYAGSLGIFLYIIHNILYASCSLPAGYLGDRVGKRNILLIGYFLIGIVSFGFVLSNISLYHFALLFFLSGVGTAIVHALEKGVAADLLPPHVRGTGYGVLGAVNGAGDFVSSVAVGLLWTYVSPVTGFLYGGVMCVLGAITLFYVKNKKYDGVPKMTEIAD